ncbi:hypothetical protein DW653_07700 [Phocaeicola plebeius]|uniref:Uncharacterized protein n=1 Tax=Phocaeicola plebeius TaxID=310297 RepID=A0A414RE73_9BACT|nr:hypothetical protein DW653_07700 [Phocaeicola plebeius]
MLNVYIILSDDFSIRSARIRKADGQLVMLGFAVSSFTPASYQRCRLQRPSRNLILWPASHLDAFSAYPIPT